ncbi:MAG: hypothetical protein SGI98_10010 [Verrucomicrobiota bacterium]|nr:hypothetical protein [Verrucomicrobiota bacterium]
MITAIDADILVDILGTANQFTGASMNTLDDARAAGSVVIAPDAAVALTLYLDSPGQMQVLMEEMEMRIIPHTFESIHLAGRVWIDYRRRSSKPKDRVLTDFLIGSHALDFVDALISRDQGYFRTYFLKLKK